MPKEQVIIIGGGPAGVACAVQLKRYGIDPLLFEKDIIGGLVKNAWRLDNYPGYPDGIGGVEMAVKLKKHLERFEVRYQKSEIRKAKFVEGQFVLETDELESICKYLVVATGTKAKHPSGENIYTEVYHLVGLKGKMIDIVGAGDAAFDYAMSLANHNKITIHNRGTIIRCIPALLDIAMKHENITYVENSQHSISSDYTIFATGREPDKDCLSADLMNIRAQLEQQGLLYIIGDVKNGMVRQASVAIGDGIRAAMAIRDKINK